MSDQGKKDGDAVLGSAGYYEKSIDRLDSSQAKLVSEVQETSSNAAEEWNDF